MPAVRKWRGDVVPLLHAKELAMNEQNNELLRLRCDIADARCGVAEELGWPFSLVSALAMYFKWQSLLLAVGVAVVVYYLSVHRYQKARDAAWDKYERVTNTGRFYRDKS